MQKGEPGKIMVKREENLDIDEKISEGNEERREKLQIKRGQEMRKSNKTNEKENRMKNYKNKWGEV